MTRRVRPRRGVSLTEVLVAMFIMAVGMIAIFTLFPLGAMQVGQALRDDRTSQTAQQADGYIRDLWRNHVVAELDAGRQPTEPFYWAMNDPNQHCDPPTNLSSSAAVMAHTPKRVRTNGTVGYSFLTPTGFQLPAGNNAPVTAGANPVMSPTMLTQDRTSTPAVAADETHNGTMIRYTNGSFGSHPIRPPGRSELPSYPVLIDPLGYISLLSTSPNQAWTARGSTSATDRILIPRRQFNAVGQVPGVSPSRALTVAGMTDDVIFDANGSPPSAAGAMTRQGRYTWAALVQRPDVGQQSAASPPPPTRTADLTILTFDGRSRSLATGGDGSAFNDEYVTAPYDPTLSGVPFGVNTRTVMVRLPVRNSDDPVLIRRGGWLVDGTIDNNTTTAVPYPRREVHFYRITAVTEEGTAGGLVTYTLDLEVPLKETLWPEPVAPGQPAASQLYFFAGLAEVFPRPRLEPDANY